MNLKTSSEKQSMKRKAIKKAISAKQWKKRYSAGLRNRIRRNRILSEAEKEKAIEEIRQNLKTRLDQLKQLQTVGKVRLDDYSKHSPPSTYMNAKWSWTFFKMTIDNLIDIWEWLQLIMEGVIEDEEDITISKTQIQRLHEQFMKYSPMLNDFKEALEQSKKIREKFR